MPNVPIVDSASDTGADITSEVTVYSATLDASNNRRVAPVIRLSSLNGADAIISVEITNDGVLHPLHNEIKAVATATTLQIEVPTIHVKANTTLAITVISDNGSDTSVDWEIDLFAADSEVSNQSIVDYALDHLIAVAESGDVVDNSVIAKLAAIGGDWSDFNSNNDSLEKLRDAIDAETALILLMDAAVDANAAQLGSILTIAQRLQTATRATAWTGTTPTSAGPQDDIVGLLEMMLNENLPAANMPAGAEYADGSYDPATDSLPALAATAGTIAGTGSEICTLQLLDTLSNQLNDVEVWISTDQAGSNVVAGTKETDANGYVVFQLDTGTYYRWAQKNGYNFDNPQQFTITTSVVTATFNDATLATASSSATLEAVNRMLEAIGEPNASALDTGGTSDAGQAEAMLDRVTKDVLSNGPNELGGWCVNTHLEKVYTPNSSDQIEIPSTIISIERSSTGDKYTYRNGLLYDPKEESYTFTDTVKLNVIEDIDFEDLSYKLRRYIAVKAAFEFQRWKKRGQYDDALARETMLHYKAEAEQEDQDLSDRMNDKISLIRAIKGNRRTRKPLR